LLKVISSNCGFGIILESSNSYFNVAALALIGTISWDLHKALIVLKYGVLETLYNMLGNFNNYFWAWIKNLIISHLS
jgi:hypothetical protein